MIKYYSNDYKSFFSFNSIHDNFNVWLVFNVCSLQKYKLKVNLADELELNYLSRTFLQSSSWISCSKWKHQNLKKYKQQLQDLMYISIYDLYLWFFINFLQMSLTHANLLFSLSNFTLSKTNFHTNWVSTLFQRKRNLFK